MNEEKRVLEIIKLKRLCRIRGLTLDIQNGHEYFKSAKSEYEELYRHLDKLKWIIADIECAYKYLSDDERKLFKKLTDSKVEEDNNE